MRSKPEYLPARVALGVTLYSVGRKADAVSEWTRVLEIDPNEKSARAYLKMMEEQDAPEPGSALHDKPSG